GPAPAPPAGARPGRRGKAARRSASPPSGEGEPDAGSCRRAIRRRIGNPAQVEIGGGARHDDPVAYLRAPRLQPARIEACEEIQILPPQCLDDRAVQILRDDEMAQSSGGHPADAELLGM